MVGVAVKVVFVPEQIVVVPEILTLTGKFGFTVTVKLLDVAGLPVAQVALDVTIQVTASALDNVVLEYVLLLVPTLAPFTCH